MRRVQDGGSGMPLVGATAKARGRRCGGRGPALAWLLFLLLGLSFVVLVLPCVTPVRIGDCEFVASLDRVPPRARLLIAPAATDRRDPRGYEIGIGWAVDTRGWRYTWLRYRGRRENW